jgi:4'-phosphopantetheinyl transferase EntD
VIETILPGAVISAEAREDSEDIVLFPAEEASVGRAVDKRRREFTTARACVREAFRELGLQSSAVPNGARGEPLWPAGIVGSITHCKGYRACAIARTTQMTTIGIDAEPHAALPEGLLGEIAVAQELSWLRERRRDAPDVHWDRLLFSAKESVYKAWFPLAKRWLGFEDAAVSIDAAARTFTARLLVAAPAVEGQQLTGFDGRWLIGDGLVLTAIALPSRREPAPARISPSSAAPRQSR